MEFKTALKALESYEGLVISIGKKLNKPHTNEVMSILRASLTDEQIIAACNKIKKDWVYAWLPNAAHIIAAAPTLHKANSSESCIRCNNTGFRSTSSDIPGRAPTALRCDCPMGDSKPNYIARYIDFL